MRFFALVAVVMFTMGVNANAGRRGGGGHTSSHSSGMRGTGSSSSSHSVRGYTKKSGTFVAPHRQTNGDHTQLNNFSTKGNVNPSNGKAGARDATH